MISRSIKVTYGFEPPRSGAASPSSVRNPYLTFLSSRIHLRFKPFGALADQVDAWKVIIGGAITAFLSVLAKHLADDLYNTGKRLLKTGFEGLKKLVRRYL